MSAHEHEFLHRLADSVYVVVLPEYDDLGNEGIIVTDEGVVAIDSDVRTVDRLFAALPGITAKPLRFLINTHHAFDHSSANCFFADRGVAVIGSQSCRDAMISHGELNFRRWSDREPPIKKILEEKKPRIVPPHITFDSHLRLHLGGKTLELFHYGHAHSPGDVFIYLPEEQILFGGDLLWIGFFPNVREADVPNQIRVVDRILELPVRHYVPGHGGVTSNRNDIVTMRNFLASLYERITAMVGEGKSREEVNALGDPFAALHPDWRGRNFLSTAIDVIYASLTSRKA
jgi:cyclase